jgi:hemoglobin
MGQEAIFRMCVDFYVLLKASEIGPMFPEDAVQASRKLAMFLCSAFGGPPLYQQAFGPPRMRARHLPFVIGEKERRIWLDCFNRILEHAERDYGFPGAEIPVFQQYLEGFSAWMVNQA